MLIYKVTNLLNNKIYVGQTHKTLEYRKQQHLNTAKRGKGSRFHEALRKYGFENFKFEILEDNIETIEDLNNRERYWISYYNSYMHGYNSTKGGDDNPMFNDISFARHSSKVKSIEWRQEHSRIMKDIVAKNGFTEEHRRKISQKLKGNQHFKGHKRTPESIAATVRGLVKTVYCVNTNNCKLQEFSSVRDASSWWYHNGYDTVKDEYSLCDMIKRSSKNNEFIHGIKWIYK